MKIILNTLCLTIAVLLGGTRSIAEAADYPKYDGHISSIDKPLLLINRPHPRSKWSIRGTGSFAFNEEKINFEQLITGKTEVIQSGSSIVQRLEIDDFQNNLMKGQEAPDMSLIQTTLIKLTMAPSGQYKKIDVESSIHKVTNQDKNKLDRFFAKATGPAVTFPTKAAELQAKHKKWSWTDADSLSQCMLKDLYQQDRQRRMSSMA